MVTVRTVINGTISNETYTAGVEHRDAMSARLRAMEVENRGPGSLVRFYTAGKIGSNGLPEWRVLKDLTFPFPLDKQGFANEKDALFVGAKLSATTRARGTTSRAATS